MLVEPLAIPVSTPEPVRRETVAFVIPLYNEETVFPLLFQEIAAYRAEHPEVSQVIFIDDGSQDQTAALVRELTVDQSGYILLRFSRNFGHQVAITAGMHFVEADAAVVLDGDLQDPLWVVTKMIAKWREGYDVVYGIRKKREGEPLLRRAAMRVFYRFFQRITDINAPLDAGDFRLVSRRVLDAYATLHERQPYVRGLISWVGFNQTGVAYERPARAAGETKYPYRKLIKLALDGITSFSYKPLELAVRVGLMLSGLSMLGVIWVIAVKLMASDLLPGWASIVFIGFFFGGLQLFFTGILGTYLARVYEEVKGRPRYIIQEQWRSRDAVGDER